MRIAVLGLGFMGSTHIKAMRGLPDVTLAAVCTNDPKALSGDLSSIQGNLGGPGEKLDFTGVAKYAEIDDVLADPNVDAVDICLPTTLHVPVAMKAMQAGKHVLLEKPMALSGADCDLLVAESHKQKRTLMVAQVLRFFPMYRALREELPNLGAARNAIFRRRCAAPAWSQWLKDKSQSGGGVFDLLIHDVDIANYLFGMPRAVTATGYENLDAGLDIITAQLHYDHIPSVTISGGWHHPASYPFSMEYTVCAEGGTVDYSTNNRPPSLYNAAGEASLLALDDVDGYAAEIQYFADCVNAGVQPEKCMPANSAQSVHIALCMNESRARGGVLIEC